MSKSNRKPNIRWTEEKLIQELKKVADEVGHPPTTDEFEEIADCTPKPVFDRFGSWYDALDAAGLEGYQRHDEPKIDTDDLLHAIEELADELGRVPKASEMDEQGPYHSGTYANRFGSWINAVQKAGFSPHRKQKVSDEELIRNLQRLSHKLDKTPTWADMKESEYHHPVCYHRRFGSWKAALEEADLGLPDIEISDDELLKELNELAIALDKTPSQEEMRKYGAHSGWTYRQRFGSWTAAIKKANLEPLKQEIDMDNVQESPSNLNAIGEFEQFDNKGARVVHPDKPIATIMPQGQLRLNSTARKRWFSDAEHVEYLLAVDDSLLGVRPVDEPHENSYSLSNGLANVKLVLFEYGIDSSDFESTKYFELDYSESVDAAVLDLSPIVEEFAD